MEEKIKLMNKSRNIFFHDYELLDQIRYMPQNVVNSEKNGPIKNRFNNCVIIPTLFMLTYVESQVQDH